MKIASERRYRSWPSWDIVYEWEEEMSKTCGWEIENLYGEYLANISFGLRKILRRIKIVPNKFSVGSDSSGWKICWIMDAKYFTLYTKHDIIPIFLDFSVEMIDTIIDATSKLPCFWVTNYCIYKLMKLKECKNVYFIPLSVPDKYLNEKIAYKDIDVIQFGRKNEILHNYMLRYCSENANVEYIYQTDDGTLTYESTTKGNIGKFDNRKEYMKLLSRCKVSLVSTPGIDNGRMFGKNIDFFTPRFYESAANYCFLLGRYTENEECNLIGIKQICENVNSYQQFKKLLDVNLKNNWQDNVSKFQEFLDLNKTSNRAAEIKKVIDNIITG